MPNHSEQAIIDELVGNAHGNLSRVKELVEASPALVHARSSWNESPIEAALHMANREIVQYLLAQGASLDVFAAAVLGQADRVADFLRADRKLAQAVGVHGIPILYYPAAAGHVGICQLLLDNGADVNAGAGGNTPLHGAAFFGQAETATWLLENGADANALNYEGKTPLAVAIDRQHQVVADLLRARDAHV